MNPAGRKKKTRNSTLIFPSFGGRPILSFRPPPAGLSACRQSFNGSDSMPLRSSLQHASAPARLSTTRAGQPAMSRTARRVQLLDRLVSRSSHTDSPKWRPFSVLDEYDSPPCLCPACRGLAAMPCAHTPCVLDGLRGRPVPSVCANSWSSAAL